MASVLAVDIAEGCAKILVPLLCFLGGPSPRSPATDQAVVTLLVVLPTAYVAGVIVEHFASVVLAYLHPAAPATLPAPASATLPALALATLPAPTSSTASSSVYLGRFVVLIFTLAFAWLIVVAVQLAAVFFLGGFGQRFGMNVLR